MALWIDVWFAHDVKEPLVRTKAVFLILGGRVILWFSHYCYCVTVHNVWETIIRVKLKQIDNEKADNKNESDTNEWQKGSPKALAFAYL